MRSLLAPAAAPALLLTLLLAAPAHAESADTAPQWDGSHMQSNFANRLGTPAPIEIVGSNRFDADATAAPTGVQEQILQVSPHGWEPGGARNGGGASDPIWGHTSSGFSSTKGVKPQRSSGVALGSSLGAKRNRR
jgi:hypothetical protein